MKQIFLCLSTTGSSPTEGHRIIEIGGVLVENRKMTGKHFHAYINPNREIEESFIAEHGITDEFLKDKPEFISISEELEKFLGNSEIILNKEHDSKFLENEFSLIRRKPQNSQIIETKPSTIQSLLSQTAYSTFKKAEEIYRSEVKNLYGALLDAEILADAYLSATKNEIIITDINDFLEQVSNTDPNDLFRGVSNRNFRLLPSLFRHHSNEHLIREDKMMWVFKAHSRPHLEKQPENEIQWLTLAQHHGLPTRLLDWSFSPLVACFFAVKENLEKDGAVYLYEAREYKREEKINIAKLDKTVVFLPSHGSKRITAQSGAFTLHPNSHPEIGEPAITKFIIPSKLKPTFIKCLSKYGINNSTIFPDLDGLCAHIKQQQGY